MSENKERYTPGLWKVAVGAYSQEIISQWQSNCLVATTHNINDARLIAEAPNLFQLVKQYLDMGVNCSCSNCRAARRIVARVLGEE